MLNDRKIVWFRTKTGKISKNFHKNSKKLENLEIFWKFLRIFWKLVRPGYECVTTIATTAKTLKGNVKIRAIIRWSFHKAALFVHSNWNSNAKSNKNVNYHVCYRRFLNFYLSKLPHTKWKRQTQKIHDHCLHKTLHYFEFQLEEFCNKNKKLFFYFVSAHIILLFIFVSF